MKSVFVALVVIVMCCLIHSCSCGSDLSMNFTEVSITRDQVIARAKEWMEKKIPYCQCNSDCCG